MSLSNAILGLLTYMPMTGYNLKKIFDRSVSHVWAASLSQIYRELSTLEKKGYVTSKIEKQEDKPDKKVYTITEEGKNAFNHWLGDFPEKSLSPIRDDFLLRIFFGSQLEKDQLINEFKRYILQREEYLKLLMHIEENFSTYCREFPISSPEKEMIFWHFTIKMGMMTLETTITWAKQCIDELERIGDQ